jgi:ATP-dependent RNA helicase DeaD
VFDNLSQPQSEQLLTILHNAGYAQPTLLQEKVVPQIFSGRDMLVETLYAEGRTAAFLLPLCLSAPSDSIHPQALIIAVGAGLVHKTALQFRRIAKANKLPHRLITLGWESPIKREVKLIANGSDIIVGTSERIIDHLRRSSIAFHALRTVIVNLEELGNVEGFHRDVMFILSKIPKRSQVVVFTPSLRETVPLEQELRRPLVVRSEDWDQDNRIQSVYEAADPVHKAELLLSLFLSGRITKAVIFCRTMAALKILEKKLAAEGISRRIISTRTSARQSEEIIRRFTAGEFPCILTVKSSLLSDVDSMTHAVFFNLPVSPEDYGEIGQELTLRSKAKVITFVTKEESETLQDLQEKNKMKKENLPDNDEVIRGKVKSIVNRIRHDEDAAELNHYRKLIRKNVPFTLRGYFSALLFKEALGNTVRVNDPFKTIFVSIGRNRRVFPRDLSKLFTQTLDIPPADVGSIKVLDNYSFIDIPASHAQAALDQLDGTEFHGRKITVNFARKKEEKILR